jgi:hypothetical protein
VSACPPKPLNSSQAVFLTMINLIVCTGGSTLWP